MKMELLISQLFPPGMNEKILGGGGGGATHKDENKE